MKNLIIVILSVLVLIGFAYIGNSHLPIRVFRRAGEVSLGGTRIFADTITCTTGNAMSIDLTVAGFSTLPRIQVTAMRNTGSAMSVPNVSVKSITTTAVVVNVTEFTSTTILGIPVLGSVQFVATPSDVLLIIQAVGS